MATAIEDGEQLSFHIITFIKSETEHMTGTSLELS
jgi:hypothetical protein